MYVYDKICTGQGTPPAGRPHNSFIHSTDTCRMRQFLAILRSFFHYSLIYTLSFHPFPTSLPSSLTSSCHLFLGLPLSLVVSWFIYNMFLGMDGLISDFVSTSYVCNYFHYCIYIVIWGPSIGRAPNLVLHWDKECLQSALMLCNHRSMFHRYNLTSVTFILFIPWIVNWFLNSISTNKCTILYIMYFTPPPTPPKSGSEQCGRHTPARTW